MKYKIFCFPIQSNSIQFDPTQVEVGAEALRVRGVATQAQHRNAALVSALCALHAFLLSVPASFKDLLPQSVSSHSHLFVFVLDRIGLDSNVGNADDIEF